MCACRTLLTDCEVRGEPVVCIHMHMRTHIYVYVCACVQRCSLIVKFVARLWYIHTNICVRVCVSGTLLTDCEVRGEPVVCIHMHMCVGVHKVAQRSRSSWRAHGIHIRVYVRVPGHVCV